jgi:hypothetical protein
VPRLATASAAAAPGPRVGTVSIRSELAFLERYPSPTDARRLGEARLAAFLARERYSAVQQPAQLISKLRRALGVASVNSS